MFLNSQMVKNSQDNVAENSTSSSSLESDSELDSDRKVSDVSAHDPILRSISAPCALADPVCADYESDPSSAVRGHIGCKSASVSPSVCETFTQSRIANSYDFDRFPNRQQETGNADCEICSKYEGQLSHIQKEHTSTTNRLNATLAELHAIKKSSEEMETRMRAEKTLFEEKTLGFEEQLRNMSQRMDFLLKNYQEYRRSTEAEFTRLANEREAAQSEMSLIEDHYRTLLGKRRDAAAAMTAPIDLPQDKLDLELYALKLREDFLSADVAREHLLHQLDDQATIQRDLLSQEQRRRTQIETLLQNRLSEAQATIDQLAREAEASRQSADARAAAERAAEKAASEVKQATAQVQKLTESLERSNSEIRQLKSKVVSLQADLNNSEVVQKDFVLLSQRLQIELQRQREQNTEVRWQDAEDVASCNSCGCHFPTGSAGVQWKSNCRHCGRIFCSACLNKTIAPGGQRSRPAKVCDVCHTLLVKDAAPYFSRANFNSSNSQFSPPPSVPEKLNRLLDIVHSRAPELASPLSQKPKRPPPFVVRHESQSMSDPNASQIVIPPANHN